MVKRLLSYTAWKGTVGPCEDFSNQSTDSLQGLLHLEGVCVSPCVDMHVDIGRIHSCPITPSCSKRHLHFLNHITNLVHSYRRNDQKIYLPYVGGEVPLCSQGVLSKFLELMPSKSDGAELLLVPASNSSRATVCLTVF